MTAAAPLLTGAHMLRVNGACDHPVLQHLLDGHRTPQLRVGVQAAVEPVLRDDPGEVLGGAAGSARGTCAPCSA